MRSVIPARLEEGRLQHSHYGSSVADGPMGVFIVMGPKGTELKILSSGSDNEYGWEHVSVSTERRTPNWDEMCFVKDLFWSDDEVVMQLHPARSNYINIHPNCLHLWKPLKDEIPLPPKLLIG